MKAAAFWSGVLTAILLGGAVYGLWLVGSRVGAQIESGERARCSEYAARGLETKVTANTLCKVRTPCGWKYWKDYEGH